MDIGWHLPSICDPNMDGDVTYKGREANIINSSCCLTVDIAQYCTVATFYL